MGTFVKPPPIVPPKPPINWRPYLIAIAAAAVIGGGVVAAMVYFTPTSVYQPNIDARAAAIEKRLDTAKTQQELTALTATLADDPDLRPIALDTSLLKQLQEDDSDDGAPEDDAALPSARPGEWGELEKRREDELAEQARERRDAQRRALASAHSVHVSGNDRSFHRAGCFRLGTMVTLMSQGRARASGFTPCSACFPIE